MTPFSSRQISSQKEPVILLIDDSVSSRSHHAYLLGEKGFHHILEANNGIEALSLLANETPDVIVCDMVMPELDGIGFCRALREMDARADLPIILHSALAKPDDRARAFSAGASDLMHQPLHPDELAARIHLQLSRVNSERKVASYRSRIERELEQARQMQLMLMPPPEQLNTLEQSHGLLARYFFEPSSEIGGDLWDIFSHTDTQTVFYLCDFTGHGVGAAINTFRLHALLTQHRKLFAEPGLLLTQLNEDLHRMLARGNFATFFYGIIDVESGHLTYASAGAPAPYHYEHASNSCSVLDSGGLPLGAVAGTSYDSGQIDFAPSDTLVLYSDVLPANMNAPGNTHTIDQAFIEHHFPLCLQHANADGQRRLIHNILKHTGLIQGNPLEDDLTLALITRVGHA